MLTRPEDNPYRSPTDPSLGEYDHSLFWQAMRTVAVLCLFFVFIDVIAITRYVKVANPNRPLVAVVWNFFADWKSGSAPTWPDELAPIVGAKS